MSHNRNQYHRHQVTRSEWRELQRIESEMNRLIVRNQSINSCHDSETWQELNEPEPNLTPANVHLWDEM